MNVPHHWSLLLVLTTLAAATACSVRRHRAPGIRHCDHAVRGPDDALLGACLIRAAAHRLTGVRRHVDPPRRQRPDVHR